MTPAVVQGRRPHDPLAFAGRVELLAVESEVLLDNALGDPHVRELATYLPPGHGDGSDLPALFVLAPFTGRGQSYLETHPWKTGALLTYDRAVAAGEATPAVVVLPDCFTALGGSQYVNSSAVGRYADHVVDELVPLVEAELGTPADRRGVLGSSSGGFGALHLAMTRPGTFRACGSISGDCCFEYTFAGEFLACLRGLVPHGGDPARFLDAFRAEPELSGDGHAVLNVLAMSACYSPAPEAPLGFDLPFDLETGERVEAVWERWRAFDPLVAAEAHADALRDLRLLHLECGLADEFHLQWSARRLSRRLTELGVAHVHEEHAGGHRGLGGRVAALLPRLAAALQPG
jgi:enterochelin esterase family protein